MRVIIAKNQIVSEPIQLNCDENGHAIIVAEENSEVTIFEEYFDKLETHTEIFAEKNARVNFYKIQKCSAPRSTNITIQQKQDSCVKTFFANFAGENCQQIIRVNLSEKGASCYLRGLSYLTENKQQLTQDIQINHHAAHSNSDMYFKGILNKKSRSHFKGKVYVERHAQHIRAEQANHNLLLSNDAEAETRPELEIYANDVKCSHGATVGQLDPDALFYLRARGMEKSDAIKLLTQGFANDVIQKIENPYMLQRIQEQVNQYE